MELIRIEHSLDQKENTPLKIFLTSSRHNSSVESVCEEIKSSIDKDLDTIHTLGRGPLLQITDSRVSRKHAIACYHMTENQWSIIALRDCYYYSPCERSTEKDRDFKTIHWITLKKYNKISVESGLIFCFLQNCEHAYQILIKNKPVVEENYQIDQQSKLISNDDASFKDSQIFPAAIPKINYLTGKDVKERSKPNTPQVSIINSPDKNRKLPNWMIKSDITTDQNEDAIQACSTDGTSQNKQDSAMLTGNLNKSTVNLSTNSTTTRIANQNTHLSREKDTFIKNWGWAIGDLNDFEVDSKLKSGTLNEPMNSSNSNENEASTSKSKNNIEACSVPWYERSFAVANNSETTGTETKKSTDCKPHSSIRPICPFGISCYRKNPQHKIDEAHPGDNDFKEGNSADGNNIVDSNEPDNRPECEYGLQCYRKNPQHKRDYKHTSNTRASKRKASKDLKKIAKKAAGNHLSGEDDSYESDFINDESDLDDEDISSDEEGVDEWKPEDEDDD